MRTIFHTLILLALLTASSPAAVFQHTVPVATEKGQSQAFLWLPPQAKQIRGIVIGGMTLAERELAKDPAIRQACADQQLAIVFLKCGLAAADPQKVLDDLARASGYRESAVAPLFFVGHSAGGPQAKAAAIKYKDRCFGLVQYRGGIPGGAGSDIVPPGLPTLMMIGQFDEFGGTMRNAAGRETWEGGRDLLAAYRALDERNLASIVVEPGAGHFAWSDRNAAYLALFIRKAAQARIPDWPIDAAGPVTCKPIDPKTGWLTNLTINTPGQFPPAPYDQYTGDKSKAAWHFDKELADATVSYHAGGFGSKDQFIKWTDPAWVDAGARFFFTKLTWIGDGQTFEVHPVYSETYPTPQKDGQGPRWHTAGQPAGCSSAPIMVRRVSGPIIATNRNALRMQFDALAPATESSRVTFLAYSPGDREYRYTEQVGMMPRGFAGLTAGREQTISFPPIGNLKAVSPPIDLNATSDAGLPVEYHIAHGPAIIENGRLRIAEIPARASLPIEVKVVAWQFGRGIEPLVKTAKPVEQTILIEE